MVVLTILGAGSRAILARVMMPNCPSPPRTLWKRSPFFFFEQFITSPFPARSSFHKSKQCSQKKFFT